MEIIWNSIFLSLGLIFYVHILKSLGIINAGFLPFDNNLFPESLLLN